MTHHCGLVIENVKQKDQGTWKCNMDLMDEKSKIHTFNKVIDLNVRNRRRKRKKRRHDQFSLQDGYGDLYGSGDGGSGDGFGDEVSRGVIRTQLCFNKMEKITSCFMHHKVPSQLVEGRLLKLFMTGFW